MEIIQGRRGKAPVGGGIILPPPSVRHYPNYHPAPSFFSTHSSKRTGMIISSYDVANLCMVPLVSYFGAKGRRPLWLCMGAMLIFVAAIGFTMPYFLSPNYQVNRRGYSVEPRNDSCYRCIILCIVLRFCIAVFKISWFLFKEAFLISSSAASGFYCILSM